MVRLLVIGICVLAVLGGGAFWYVGSQSSPRDLLQARGFLSADPDKDFAKASDALASGQIEEAIGIIRAYQSLPAEERGKDLDWFDLEIRAYHEGKNIPQLVRLYRANAEAFDGHEEIVLLLARLFVQFRQFEDYEELYARWQTREKELEQEWFIVDVDSLLLRQRFEDAEKALKSRIFEGKTDIPRLIRLTMLTSREDLEKAWKYLDQAYSLDPRDIRVRTLRGNVLETVGQLGLARVEYIAAFLADQDNPATRDQLAEFYRRHREYTLALATWGGGLEHKGTDHIWAKTWFWNRVVQGLDFDWTAKEAPEGRFKAFADFLRYIPADQFWNEEEFLNIPENSFFARTRQEVFWLRVLNDLKQGNEEEALERLDGNEFFVISWYPRLEQSLKQILHYRLHGSLPLPVEIGDSKSQAVGQPNENLAVEASATKDSPFFLQIDAVATLSKEEQQEKMPKELRSILSGDEVFSIVFIAAGWREAGLQLLRTDTLPDDTPGWATFLIAQSIQVNRGPEEALAFISDQRMEPIVSLLQGELMIQTGLEEEGIAQLNELKADNSPIGFRASLRLSNLYTQRNEYTLAREIIASNEVLQSHTLGTELLARITFLEGNVESADELFESIKEESFVAKSYLAKRAYDQQDYNRAKELTLQLLRKYPDMLQLRANLKLIEEAKTNGKPASLPNPLDESSVDVEY